MRKIYHAILQFIANLSLKRKLVSIVSFSILMLSASGFICMKLIADEHLTLLEESVAQNLSYSATVISEHLSRLEAMTSNMLADFSIQENLAILQDSNNPRSQTTAYRQLSYRIQEYYDQFRESCPDYIALHHSQNTIYSNFLNGKRTPAYIETTLLQRSEEKEGRPVWIFDYAESDGIYLVRQIRDPQSASFRSLGTIVVSVDMEKLLSTLNINEASSSDIVLLLSTEEELIYSSDEAASELYAHINKIPNGKYKILTIARHKYFVYSTLLDKYHLTYTCCIPYDSIFHSATFAVILSISILLLTGFLVLLFSQYTISTISRHTNHLVQKMQTYQAESTSAAADISANSHVSSSFGTSEKRKRDIYADRNDEFGLLNRQFDAMAERIQNLIQDNYINELWKKDAQLKALEQQIQPHFLYNTLESINWRAKAAGNNDISHMAESLGSLLRASLEKDNGNWTLEKELEITNAYIAIQKYRFEEHLDYHFNCEPVLKSACIPKFMIQPLVENAIHYGLEENTEICHIEVNIQPDFSNRLLHIYVTNNGSAFEENLLNKLRSSHIAANGLGIGLINIDERIKLMFGAVYGLTLYNRRDNAIAQITIPYTLTQNNSADSSAELRNLC